MAGGLSHIIIIIIITRQGKKNFHLMPAKCGLKFLLTIRNRTGLNKQRVRSNCLDWKKNSLFKRPMPPSVQSGLIYANKDHTLFGITSEITVFLACGKLPVSTDAFTY